MKHKRGFGSAVIAVLLVLMADLAIAQSPEGMPLGTAFTYQGQLKQDGTPVNGTCDFLFSLWDAVSEGNQIGSTLPVPGAAVTGGLFTARLNFDTGAFTGEKRWLEIAVCCPAGCDPKVTLEPRQELTAAPHALALPGLWTQPSLTSPNLIGGYRGNWVQSGAVGAAIGGGGQSGAENRATDNYATVDGGESNHAGDDDGDPASAPYATVGGGVNNTAGSLHATVGGGNSNAATGIAATVGGGDTNAATGNAATVGGGYANTASNFGATVGGGSNNIASGWGAIVPGGSNNHAEGEVSFAAGVDAVAAHDGCFVWGDDSALGYVTCSTINQWVARTSGGVYFYTNSDLSSGVYVAAGGNSWNGVSDRATKENLAPVDGRGILETLAALRVQEYNLKSQDPSIRHIGLVAQDFAAFGYGESDKAINMQDADGVAMAAIQGLYAENQALKEQVNGLAARVAALESRQMPARAAGLPFPWLAAGGLIVGGGMLAGWRRWRGGGR